jgi:hypothetical protein
MIASPSHAGNKFLRLGYLGDPAQLPYPVYKNRNKNNVGIMQTTETRLDMPWNKYDAHLRFHLKPEAHELLQNAWPARGELQRTPDWQKRRSPRKERRRLLLANTYHPQSQPKRTDATFTPPTRKEKPKTKGSATTEPAPAEEQPAHSAESTSSPRFTLTKKPYHTFSTWRGTLNRVRLGNEHNKLPTRETLWLGMALHAQG